MKTRKIAASSNITPGHVRAFQAATSGIYGEVSLFSCTINREPGVALVLVQDAGEGKIAVMPLFVAITESMDVQFDDERSGSGGGGGGPKDPREAFEAAQHDTTAPAPA